MTKRRGQVAKHEGPIRLIAYIRVSTTQQVDSGLSLDAQRRRLKAYAESKGAILVDEIIDPAESAKDLNRPGIQQVLAMLRDGRADGIVIAKLDRLTRSVRDMATLLDEYFKDRFQLHSLTESLDTSSYTGRLQINILMSVAEWEREAIAERTRDALAESKQQGAHLGGIPLGYVLADSESMKRRGLVKGPEDEQATLQRILELRAEGKTLREIVNVLLGEKRRTKRGGRWQAETVRLVLKRAQVAA